MQINFDPMNPREVADMINMLRILGAIDAGVAITIDGEPTLTEAEARRMQTDVQRRFNMHRQQAPIPATAPTIDIGDL